MRGKDLEGGGHGLTEVIFWYLLGGAEDSTAGILAEIRIGNL
jgi:hypothetical protein